ncbi:amidohydrolase [Candidatus Saccharibacteria bacterium]|nr:amidohydrolase [Candidatus Saccharibacteria bacterium]
MRILIKGGKVLLREEEQFKVTRGDVIVKDKLIDKIILEDGAKTKNNVEHFDKVIDASDTLVMPGLINAHTHAYMSIFRNYADDLEFFDWLNSVEVVEDKMTGEDCYWTSLLSIIEMIKTGTTCFVDMCMKSSIDGVKNGPKSVVSGAVNDSGMRAFIGRGLVDIVGEEGAKRRLNEFLEDMKLNVDNERINYILAPHAPYSCSHEYLGEISKVASENNMLATIHVAESETEVKNIKTEFGVTPVKYVDDTRLFDNPVVIAHAVNLTDKDVKILKEKNVSVAINPRSNMKLGNGFANVQKLLDAGINICLGTDGSGSNNTQNMFQEMQFASLVYKGSAKRAKCMDAEGVLEAATINGAKALKMEGHLGELKEGALADIVILDLNVPEFVPQNDLVSALCYSANGSEVKTVLIDGEVVMEDRIILTLDEKEIYEKCNGIVNRLGMSIE